MKIKEPGSGGDLYPGSFSRNKEYYEKFNYVKLIRSFLGNRAITLCDIGARYGESTNWFAQHFNISVAHLFEPNPNLEVSIDKRIGKVFIHRVALSNENTYKEFYIHELDGMSSLEKINTDSTDSLSYATDAKTSSIKVKTIMLDSLSVKNIDIVKIDVQAPELSVLEGGVNTFRNAKVILVEVSMYDLYSNRSKIGKIEDLLPNHLLFSIPFISYNPKNFRTDWVELFFVHKQIVQSTIKN